MTAVVVLSTPRLPLTTARIIVFDKDDAKKDFFWLIVRFCYIDNSSHHIMGADVWSLIVIKLD
ncbi:MAG: hypothetical protein ACP8RL_06095 [cyanobacterium endosymbiont of Rhopalodia inflata]